MDGGVSSPRVRDVIQHGLAPLAPDMCSLSMEAPVRQLTTVKEPLRSIICSSSVAAPVPERWFEVALHNHYQPEDRAFTMPLHGAGVELFHAFLAADMCIICRGQKTKVRHIKAYMRSKYGIGLRHLSHALKISPLGDFLDSPRVRAVQATCPHLNHMTQVRCKSGKPPYTPTSLLSTLQMQSNERTN